MAAAAAAVEAVEAGEGLGIFAKYGAKFGAKVGKGVLKFAGKAIARGAKLTEEESVEAIEKSAEISGDLISKEVTLEGKHIGDEFKDVKGLKNFAKKVVEGGTGSGSGFTVPDSSESESESDTFDALKNLAKNHATHHENTINDTDGNPITSPKLLDRAYAFTARTALAKAHGIEMDDHMKKFYEKNPKMVDDIAHMHAHDAALKLNDVNSKDKHTAATAEAKSHANSMLEHIGPERAKCKSLEKLKEATEGIVKSLDGKGKLGDEDIVAISQCAMDLYNDVERLSEHCDNSFLEKHQGLISNTTQQMSKAKDVKDNKYHELDPAQVDFHKSTTMHEAVKNYEHTGDPENPGDHENTRDSEDSDCKKIYASMIAKLNTIKKQVSDLEVHGDSSAAVVHSTPTPVASVGGSKRIVRSYKNKRKTVNKKNRSKYTKRNTVNKRKSVNKKKTVNKRKRITIKSIRTKRKSRK